MRFVLWGAVLSSALSGSVFMAPSADAAGLDGLHRKIQVGNRLCMAGHKHHGTSNSAPTRAHALASAAQHWNSFTALEYGDEWADFRNAHTPEVHCRQSGHAAWRCDITASPCRVNGHSPAVPVAVRHARPGRSAPVYHGVPAHR